MALNDASVQVTVKGTLSSALDLKSVQSALSFSKSTPWSNGTGANQADKMWDDIRTLAASGTEDLDLAGSALLDPFGAAVVFARIKGLIVVADAANTNNVIVGANVINGWASLIGPTGASGGTVTLRPGAWFAAGCGDATGWAVTGGTNDLLHIANSGAGTSVTYSIVIIGASA